MRRWEKTNKVQTGGTSSTQDREKKVTFHSIAEIQRGWKECDDIQKVEQHLKYVYIGYFSGNMLLFIFCETFLF